MAQQLAAVDGSGRAVTNAVIQQRLPARPYQRPAFLPFLANYFISVGGCTGLYYNNNMMLSSTARIRIRQPSMMTTTTPTSLARGRQIQRHRPLRRHLSAYRQERARTAASRQFSTASSSATPVQQTASVPPISVSRLRSRRVVRRTQRQQEQKSGKDSKPEKESSASKAADEKPWPKSVVYAAYAAGATLVPYTLVWISLTDPNLREIAWSSSSSSVDKNSDIDIDPGDGIPLVLRRHFGEEDWNSVPYVDVLDDAEGAVTDKSKVPYRLAGERSWHDEATRRASDRRIHPSRRIEIRLTPIPRDVVDANWNDIGPQLKGVTFVLPASERANTSNLLKHLLVSSSSAGEQFENADDLSVVAVDFPSEEKDEDDTAPAADASSASSTSTTTISFGDERDASPSSDLEPTAASAKKDPLLRKIHTYSTWYYQNPALIPGVNDTENKKDARTAHHVTASVTNEDMQIQQLEFDVRRLEAELRDLAATRPFDDIREDLDRSKSALRRLKWKRWMPW